MKRVICGPGPDGRNVVLHEGPPRAVGPDAGSDLAEASEQAGESMFYAWAAPGPVASTDDFAAEMDPFNFRLGPGETRFMRVEVAPGGSSPMHRTPYITDYLVALSGELTMELEDGSTTKFGAGDMLVQLGGMHAWRNEGSEPFVMAGVVVGVESELDVPNGVMFAQEEEV